MKSTANLYKDKEKLSKEVHKLACLGVCWLGSSDSRVVVVN